MRGFFPSLLGAVFAVVAMQAFVPSGGMGLSVDARSVVPPQGTLQYVDRTRKGDRLDISVTTIDKQIWKKPAKILDGCDPAFSPLAGAASANFPGRCAT